MAFFSVVDNEEWEVKNRSSEDLKEWFKFYCEWCWRRGYGNCDNCRKYYKHLLYRIKMREFKESKNKLEGKT